MPSPGLHSCSGTMRHVDADHGFEKLRVRRDPAELASKGSLAVT